MTNRFRLIVLLGLIIALPVAAQSGPSYKETTAWLKKTLEQYEVALDKDYLDYTCVWTFDDKSAYVIRDETFKNPKSSFTKNVAFFNLARLAPGKDLYEEDERKGCYAVALFSKQDSKSVKWVIKSGDADPNPSISYYNSLSILIPDKDLAERVLKAFSHAIELAAAMEPF